MQEKTHWSESDDLEMMFQGTYRSDFYRSIRDLLHDQVKLEQTRGRPAVDDRLRARAHIQRRWELLTKGERDFRTAEVVRLEAAQGR